MFWEIINIICSKRLCADSL